MIPAKITAAIESMTLDELKEFFEFLDAEPYAVHTLIEVIGDRIQPFDPSYFGDDPDDG